MRIYGQKIGELTPEQRLRLALEIIGELARDVRQGSKGIRLPEPASAAVFKLIDEIQCFFRLPFERRSPPPAVDRLARDGNAVGDHHDRHSVDRKCDKGTA